MKHTSFLFLNLGGDFLSLHQRIASEGYRCYSWYDPDAVKGNGKAGKGMIELVDDPHDVINSFKNNKDNLIIMADDNREGDWIDYLKYEGWHVFGSSHYADEAENEREKGYELAKHISLEVSPYMTFKTIEDAKKYMQRIAKKDPTMQFVFKGDGSDLGGTSYTYVAKDMADLLFYLDWVQGDIERHNKKLDTFVLQKVVNGVEVDVASYYNGQKFLNAMPLCFEQKKFNGLGAAHGCLGQVLTILPAKDQPYFRNYLHKLSPYIEGTTPNYWAANNIISEENHKPYFLEWTPRCFPATEKLFVKTGDYEGQMSSEEIYEYIEKGRFIELLTPNGYSPIIDSATRKYTGKMISILVIDNHEKKFWGKKIVNRVLTVTEDHPIAVLDTFSEANTITRLSTVKMYRKYNNYDRQYQVRVMEVKSYPVIEEKVYDFKVKDESHSIVTASGIIVHNCGWDSTIGELAILQDAGKSIAEFYIALATQQPLPKDFFPYGKWSASVRLMSKGTYAKDDDVNGRPISWKPEIEKNLWWYGIRDREGNYEITGNPFGIATAVADTPDEAVSKVYTMIDPKNGFLSTPDLMYSPYIGKGVTDSIKKLNNWGIIKV